MHTNLLKELLLLPKEKSPPSLFNTIDNLDLYQIKNNLAFEKDKVIFCNYFMWHY